MKRLLVLALSVGLLAQPAQVDAQLLYNGTPDATEYMQFLGGSGVSGGYGVQVGPYLAQFTTPTSPTFSIYCVDYNHYARSGWVNTTSLASAASLGNTRLGLNATESFAADYARYRQAAYLATLFDTGGQPTSEWGRIHAAIWALTSGVTPGNTGNYLTAAWAAPSTFSTDGWYVLTPTNPGSSSSGQEFLMRTTRVSVPEPAAILLLATGLLMLAMVSRQRIGLERGA